MTRRLLVSYLSVTLLVLVLLEVPLGVVFSQRERERMAADVEHDATVIASLYEDGLERDLPLEPRAAEGYAARTGARVVVVDDAGISLIDTGDTVDRDFSTRPEMGLALDGVGSTGIRSSETLGIDLMYVAVPVASGGVVHGAVRVTLDTNDVDGRIQRVWVSLVGVGLVVLAAVGLVGWGLARSLTRPLRRLHTNAARFADGDLRVSDERVDGPAEIRELDETLATMARRLDQLIQAQRAFVADASHQLRTPLTALRLRLENLQSRVPDASGAEVDAVIEETDRLSALVADLLQLVRSDEPRPVGPADLARLSGDRVDTWSAVADGRGVRLVADGVDGPVMVQAVPGAIEQVLDNLIDNALAASPSGGTVSVAVTATEEVAILRVSDQGPGLTDEEKELATRRFWRGRSAQPGTGLGLAIVTSLMTASGGSFRLDDAPEGGLAASATFLRDSLRGDAERSAPARRP